MVIFHSYVKLPEGNNYLYTKKNRIVPCATYYKIIIHNFSKHQMDETRDVEIFQTESDRQWQGSERSTVPEDIIKSKTASTVRYPMVTLNSLQMNITTKIIDKSSNKGDFP